MRAGVFVRYHSGDGFGHVGWAFEMGPGRVDAGSVENHSGHIFTPASKMGFWNGCFEDPVQQMREHRYDDFKWLDVPNADPVLAYRTVLWIKDQAYHALHRNCEDDVYDVLRAYGVQDLALPSFIWFPKTWFARFRGTLEHISEYHWPSCHPEVSKDREERAAPAAVEALRNAAPYHPTWRRPWHPHFHALNLARLRFTVRP